MMLSSLQLETKTTKTNKVWLPDITPVKVEFCEQPGFVRNCKVRGYKAQGLKYEAYVLGWLEKELGEQWESHPKQWFRWMGLDRNWHFCQPDFFAVRADGGSGVLVECKLTRTAKAWWQLNKLYLPMVQMMYPGVEFARVEVASRVVHVDVPEKVRIVHLLEDVKLGATSFLKIPWM